MREEILKNRCLFPILLILYAALAIGPAIAFFYPLYSDSRHVTSLRLPADNSLLNLGMLERGAIENQGEGSHVWSLRMAANGECVAPAFISAIQFCEDAPILVARQLNGERHIFDPPDPKAPPHLLAPLLAQDGAVAPRLFAAQPRDYGDALDLSGQPIRWRLPDNLMAGYNLLRPSRPELESGGEVKIPDSAPRLPRLARLATSNKAANYRGLVESFARRFNLSVPLVMAIIHSESDFSPTLVSNKSAMGLMQLLPSTASDEVHRFLYGRRGQVSLAQLSVPETNIHYGTAYLHILLNRYFAEVKNVDVRESCAIAAYNMGPNRFLRLYGPNPAQAVETINTMSTDEFYQDLYSRLPVRETKYYVSKVRQMKRHYAGQP